MNDNNFKKALSDSLRAEYDEMLPDADDVHTFSPEFEKKMKKLIHRRRKPFYRLINTAAKRVACVLVVLLTATSITAISSRSYRNRIKGFLIDTEKTHSTIRSEETTNSPETIEDIYGITYDLTGFTVKHEDNDEFDRHISYLNGDIQLNFDQHAKPTFDGDFNTEDAEIQEIEINGIKGLYFLDNNNYDHLIWDNGDYVFTMFSNIGKDELINIAESVQKVETKK